MRMKRQETRLRAIGFDQQPSSKNRVMELEEELDKEYERMQALASERT